MTMSEESTQKKVAQVPAKLRPRTYDMITAGAWAFAIAVTAWAIFFDKGAAGPVIVWLAAMWVTVRMRFFARYYRALSLLREGKLDESAALLEKVAKGRFIGNYFRWSCSIHLSLIRFAQREYSRVVDLSLMAILFARKWPALRRNAMINLHAALVRLGRKEEAEKLVPQIQALPAHPLLDFVFACNRAYALILEKKHEEALALIEPFAGKLTEIHEVSECLFDAEMAHLLDALGRKDEARQYSEKIRRTPEAKQVLCLRQNPVLASVFEEKLRESR
jgi:tetratricopeptide (TPR) repeat protein